MNARRVSTPPNTHNANMDKASKRGWKAVFANGKWEGGEEEVWVGREETIPFVSAWRVFSQMLQGETRANAADAQLRGICFWNTRCCTLMSCSWWMPLRRRY
jgi:hypothetical protein